MIMEGEDDPVNYCRLCGRILIFKTLLDGSKERYCPECDRVFFDTPSPAVIVAVIHADRILLTRSVDWTQPFWGLVAGHVKSGETAEDAAFREVREEVGLDIFALQILGTYTTRDLLMIGFTAETERDGIQKSIELETAAWFPVHEPLPLRPGSVAHQVVTRFLQTSKGPS